MAGNSQSNVIKAVSCEINLGDSFLDAYMLPSGEKRIGVENTGLVLGYSQLLFPANKTAVKSAKNHAGNGFFRRTSLGEDH